MFKTVNEELAHHLECNLDPPAPRSCLCAARRALELARQGQGEKVVPLPVALAEWCDLREPVTAAQLVEALHLDGFLPPQVSGIAPVSPASDKATSPRRG